MQTPISPAGCVIILMVAAAIDFWSVGPNSIRDRIAFLMACPTLAVAFNGSNLDRWTVQQAVMLVDQLKSMTGPAYIAGAASEVVLTGLVGGLALFAAGCMLPEKASAKLGRLAKLNFPTCTTRMNYRLWGLALLVGMLADMPDGAVGAILRWFLNSVARILAPFPNWLLGVV
jgi:hypothetical protein